MRYLRTPSLRWSLLAVLGLAALVAAAVLLGQGGIARASHSFSDVPDSAFYHDFVAFLADNGITSGCGGGRFCGEDPVTRGQMAVFLQKAGECRQRQGGIRSEAVRGRGSSTGGDEPRSPRSSWRSTTPSRRPPSGSSSTME